MKLAPRKAKWVKQFKKPSIKGNPLNPNASIKLRYEKKLKKLIEKMTQETEKKILALFRKDFSKQYFAQDDTIGSQARILMNELMERFSKLFSFHSFGISESMLNENDEWSQKSLKSSLKQLSGGLTLKTDFITGELKDALNASLAENVQLIKSIPQRYLTQVQGSVMRSITTGRGLADLIPALEKQKGITKRQAETIARDQTTKAYSNLNRIRMQKVGIKKFEWLHSAGGQHPRQLHLKVLNGNVFRMDKPPIIDEKTKERGFPGQLINCACRMIPVIEFEE